MVLKGYLEHFLFRNEDNGYTVFNLAMEKEDVICVGSFKSIEQGETLELTGEFITHNVYGEQFKVVDYKIIPPEDRTSMERYLGSGAIKGVGEALAKRIVKAFGNDTFRIIEEEPERLIEIKGISERKARDIAVQMMEKKDLREAMLFLQKYGISNTLAIKIYKEYGTDMYAVLQENPYKMAEDITGIGFKIADEIARKTGIKTDSDYRIRSGILYTLMQAVNEGHTYLPMEVLKEKAGMLLGIDKEVLAPQIANLAMDKKIMLKTYEDKVCAYAMSLYFAEQNCARKLWELNIPFADGKKHVLAKLDKLQDDSGIFLDELQKKAVVESVCNGVFILTGGPGTGKTTTINAMIRYFESEGLEFYLAAPTGRAAKRMTETTGYEARTLHRLLELNGRLEGDTAFRAGFEKNEDNPIEADVVIVDEMSMVDMFVFQALLKALIPGTRLIMVGDVNQLPSVGPGQVLHDLIESGCFKVVMLETIFRQAKESDIVVNAHKIYKGQQILLDNKSKDFFFMERRDGAGVENTVVELVKERLPKYVRGTSADIQVLTPMRKGPLGVEGLNPLLQKAINPESGNKNEIEVGNILFREGDKVMQIKNNYQLEWEIVSKYNIPIDKGMGIFNGDIGTILTIDSVNREMCVEFDDKRKVTYNYENLEELELAYAITIHKSQGSEYPAVVLPVLTGPRLLFNRNLLYTAITRAKECVTIVGNRDMVARMIENISEYERYTSLDIAIRQMEELYESSR